MNGNLKNVYKCCYFFDFTNCFMFLKYDSYRCNALFLVVPKLNLNVVWILNCAFMPY